jgi:hypothetical protein
MASDVQIAGGVGPAPQAYEVPNATEIIPRAVSATFDGTAAGTAFLPAIEIVSDGGVVVARVATDTAVAAGGSAFVTFAPFLRAAGASAAGGGIQFDTFPQDGDWLYVRVTDGTGAPSGIPLHFYDSSTAPVGIRLESDNGEIDIQAFGNQLALSSHGVLSTLTDVSMTSDVGAFYRITVADDLRIDVGNGMSVALNFAGTMFTVLDHLGSPLFEVRENGSIHGRAAVGAITWDL